MVAQVFANPLRCQIIRTVADAGKIDGVSIAAKLGLQYDTVNKHLLVLRRQRILDGEYGEDRRRTIHSIPEAVGRVPGWLDYGVCMLRLSPDAPVLEVPRSKVIPGPSVAAAGIPTSELPPFAGAGI